MPVDPFHPISMFRDNFGRDWILCKETHLPILKEAGLTFQLVEEYPHPSDSPPCECCVPDKDFIVFKCTCDLINIASYTSGHPDNLNYECKSCGAFWKKTIRIPDDRELAHWSNETET